MRSARVAAVLLAVLLAPLAGCAQTGGTTATETGRPTATQPTATQPGATATPATPAATATGTGAPGRPGVDVVLTKSGGIAGLEDTLTVTPDGHWTRVDRAGASRTGQLSPADLDRLRQLTADPRLVAEGSATTTTTCADAFTYRLTVGPVTTGYVDCPPEVTPPAATAAVVELLTGLTD
ncbi:hypothetical protein ONA91_01030 [Micromonospora sp. DR5-3]|uniref:hypothetical protein n=1 Tax=unclassified Micromonospora TaxID=2617518 RepID=UPI0011D5680F|nr:MULTISPECIES: hypothetical protein [unclassified Micromonospora]MCW3813042.1 hypothetical protein [Micromonospora sp. DR5-3]TYC25968.1 hypothetical protein FXF52_00940 [Micromonospora sp. MP36]